MRKTYYLFYTKKNRCFVAKYLNSEKLLNNTYVLMAMHTVIHAVIGTMNMPTGVTQRGSRAKEISDAVAVSTLVVTPPATITALNVKIAGYNSATTAGRDTAFRLMLNDLKAILRNYQDAADLDPANAVLIFRSGKFGTKQIPIPPAHTFEATNNAVSGTVDLKAEGGGAHTCHDWMYSADGIVWVRMVPTVGAQTHKSGLTPTTYAYFTHELITKNGPQGLSQIIKILVS